MFCIDNNSAEFEPDAGGLAKLEMKALENVETRDYSEFETSKVAQIKVYPNPAADILNLDFPEETPTSAEIRNLQGQLVNNVQLAHGVNNISVADLDNGLYLVSAVVNGQRIVKKFTKIE